MHYTKPVKNLVCSIQLIFMHHGTKFESMISVPLLVLIVFIKLLRLFYQTMIASDISFQIPLKMASKFNSRCTRNCSRISNLLVCFIFFLLNIYLTHFLGNCLGHNFSEYSRETPFMGEIFTSFSLTDVHLEMMSKWLGIRFAVFTNDEWKLYGNWNENGLPSVIMECNNGKYQPILSIKD